MKIEKINDNQIKCTLTREDLDNRHIKLSELAYGTENAKTLFRDMMQQASYEFGFDAEDIPLMIEAIPLSTDSIILLITKVEYPDELDTRFSNFSQPGFLDDPEEFGMENTKSSPPERADDILDLFRKMAAEKQSDSDPMEETAEFIPLGQAVSNGFSHKKPTPPPTAELIVDMKKLFSFSDLDIIIQLSHVLDQFYTGQNSLYKNTMNHKYYLVVSKSSHTPEDFNKVCNILSEYGRTEKYTASAEAYFAEHCIVIYTDHALQILSQL